MPSVTREPALHYSMVCEQGTSDCSRNYGFATDVPHIQAYVAKIAWSCIASGPDVTRRQLSKLTPILSRLENASRHFFGLTLAAFLLVRKIVGIASGRSLWSLFKPKLANIPGSKHVSSQCALHKCECLDGPIHFALVNSTFWVQI